MYIQYIYNYRFYNKIWFLAVWHLPAKVCELDSLMAQKTINMDTSRYLQYSFHFIEATTVLICQITAAV